MPSGVTLAQTPRSSIGATDEKKPNTVSMDLAPEELTDRLVPNDPQISPDGRHVVFVVAPEGYKGKHPSSAVWIAAQGEQARQLTSGIAEDNDPRWSPDGTRLLFRSDRMKPGKEESQLLRPDPGWWGSDRTW